MVGKTQARLKEGHLRDFSGGQQNWRKAENMN